MPMLTPTFSPEAIAAPDAPNVITPIKNGTKRADFIDHPFEEYVVGSEYSARRGVRYFEFVITDAQDRAGGRPVTSGYIGRQPGEKVGSMVPVRSPADLRLPAIVFAVQAKLLLHVNAAAAALAPRREPAIVAALPAASTSQAGP